ncbi:histidine phosphatase family protein [Kribbella sp. NBC_01505]|uniref:histidine phosphatase family protein n=1 Tax=Kribbella sp. NBC_01505 TaxID=2903580 RepID=UPI0038666792
MFSNSAPMVLDVLPHCSSVSRDGWQGADDERPLSDKGFKEAAILATLAAAGVQAVYTSPAARCRQTVEPLAEIVGAPITLDDRLREASGFAEPAVWTEGIFAPIGQALGGAWVAGRGIAVVDELVSRHSGGHAVLCSHGDLIPAVLVHLAAAFGCPLPQVVDRGGWYRLQFGTGELSMTGIHPA